MVKIVIITWFTFLYLTNLSESLKEGDCEVCINVLEKFSDSLTNDVRRDTKKIENTFRKFCKGTKAVENKLCQLLGALEEAGNGILGEMSKSLMLNMQTDKICEKLKKRQVCDLRYEKSMSLKNVDLRKLRIRDLRKILNYWDEECEDCAEKEEFIQKIEELKPKYLHNEL